MYNKVKEFKLLEHKVTIYKENKPFYAKKYCWKINDCFWGFAFTKRGAENAARGEIFDYEWQKSISPNVRFQWEVRKRLR